MVLLLAAAKAPVEVSGDGSLATVLQAGDTALQARDAKALMAAAVALAATGAQPAEGEPDLARAGAHQAVLWGAQPGVVTAERGRLLGPGYRTIVLGAGSDFHTRQIFTGGQTARVELLALSGGAFSLSVAEDHGAPLCRRTASQGRVACAWVPLYSLPHEIVIDNQRAEPAKFYLVTY